MKSGRYIIALILTFLIEGALCFFFLGRMKVTSNDPVKINECLKSVELYYGDESSYNRSVDYVILDGNGNAVYKTKDSLSGNINDAIRNSDAILDVSLKDGTTGKMIVHNGSEEMISGIKTKLSVTIVSITVVQALIVAAYYYYLRKNIQDPFRRMNDFAVRVAGGDLDTPLMVDRKHVFGSFTEAFDLMRSEIKKARIAEKKANDDKKEMVAKLSHDIKTPVASLKSASEIGYELASDEKIKDYFNMINVKADQLTTLVDNLFNMSVNDITEISVSPSVYDSGIVRDLIRNSDHLRKANDPEVPPCPVFVDKMRLQQVFDNIFMNSYKYAGTPITVTCFRDEEYLIVRIADKGPGVPQSELPLLTQKFERGSNASSKDGAGLGLFLSDYFISRMNGRLVLENADPGFAAVVYIRVA